MARPLDWTACARADQGSGDPLLRHLCYWNVIKETCVYVMHAKMATVSFCSVCGDIEHVQSCSG